MQRQLGLFIALLVLLAWATSLVYFLGQDIGERLWLVIPALLWLTFLYTGLFITAHDAMHGAILPGRHRWNGAIGAFCLFIYALFPYNKIRRNHFEHHRHPGSPKDPDYHDGVRSGFWPWCLHFLRGYITWWQIVGMALIFNILHHFLRIPVANLLLFWVTPSLLSTLQLFYFGTYLPHREPAGGYEDRHHARSNDYSPFWSFLSCYHFGYHWEHHEYPGTPWWRLPEKRR